MGPPSGPTTEGRADRKAVVLSGGDVASSWAGKGVGRGAEVSVYDGAACVSLDCED